MVQLDLQQVRKSALINLERFMAKAKKEIANLEISGDHYLAEKKRQSLQAIWELHSELQRKIDDLEVK